MLAPRRCTLIGTLALALSASTPGLAADLPLPPSEAPVFLAIFDVRALEPGEVTSTTEGGGPVSFPVSVIDDQTVACDALAARAPLKQLKAYVECAIGHRLSGPDFNPLPTIDLRVKAADAIAASLPDLRASTAGRAISRRGSNIVAVSLQVAALRTITETVIVRCEAPFSVELERTATEYQLVFGRKPRFTIAEVARKSQIETDFNVLLTLAARFAQLKPISKSAPPPPAACERRVSTTAYASKSQAVTYGAGVVIPLAVKRASVTLDATLPAVVPELLTASVDIATASEKMRAADEFLRLEALRRQEAEDLKLFTTCPPVDPGRLDTLQQVVCVLGPKPTPNTNPLVAIDVLSKMTTPRRATFLRWAVENRTGDVRDRALAALAQIPPAAPAQPAAGREVKQTARFLSGPLEHWSLSADVFTSRQTPFKRDSGDAFVLDGKPPMFYLSLNFLFGDLPSTERKVWENIELKWLVKGSKNPFESVGFGVGLRGGYAKRFGFDFDLLSPFVGWTWTEPADSTRDRVVETRFGVGVNINKALDWVK